MNRQIILVKGINQEEFNIIKSQVEEGLASGKNRFCVYGPNDLVEIEVIEVPDTEAQTVVYNNYWKTNNEQNEQ